MNVPTLYTYQQVADVLQVCAKTVYRRFRNRKTFRLGNIVRIPESEIEALVQERMANRPSPDLAERWTRVKRTRRPSVRPSPDTRTAPKPP